MAKKIKVVTNNTYELLPEHLEHPVGETLTIPGESYTIQELLQKYTHGIVPPLHREGIYEDSDSFEDNPFRRPEADLTDIDNAQAKIEDVEKRHQQIKQTKKQKAEQKKQEQKIREKIKQEAIDKNDEQNNDNGDKDS